MVAAYTVNVFHSLVTSLEREDPMIVAPLNLYSRYYLCAHSHAFAVPAVGRKIKKIIIISELPNNFTI